MKSKIKLIVVAFFVAISTQACFASIQASLPKFKSKTELNAGVILHKIGSPEGGSFYTGRPFELDQEVYLFKYRDYDAGLQRWKTSDPSGFPDGANNIIYAPVPTADFDVQGLLKWSTLTNGNSTVIGSHAGNTITFSVWTVKTNDGASTIQLLEYVSGAPSGTDYTYNCHGYAFGNMGYWINNDQVAAIIAGDGYKEITISDKKGAKVAVWGGSDHSAKVSSIDTSGNVTQVGGKKGSVPGVASEAPSAHWSGTPTYYE